MKALVVQRAEASAGALVGKMLCHDVRDSSGQLLGRKGAPLDAGAAERLLRGQWTELHLLELGPEDIHEEEAGRRLARAAVGDGVEVKGYAGGQWPLASSRRGLLKVRTEVLFSVNAVEGVSVFTLFDGQPVEAGEVVARAKVTPLAISAAIVAEVERVARDAGGLLLVSAFKPFTIGAVARESLDEPQRSRFESALREKITWFGSHLLPVRSAASDPRAVAREMEALKAQGTEIFIVAGTSALDPLDPVFGALSLLGVRTERHGAPAHPGSLFWLAYWAERPVIGMPTCGMFSQATTFDLILPRLLIGERVGSTEIAVLGHGGLLSREMSFRFPSYRAHANRGELPEDS
ncbi:MAG: hypothetical protein ACE5JD_08800 [Candidatus Methylomirabilia bacterium]